jgi:hypothetical protein
MAALSGGLINYDEEPTAHIDIAAAWVMAEVGTVRGRAFARDAEAIHHVPTGGDHGHRVLNVTERPVSNGRPPPGRAERA